MKVTTLELNQLKQLRTQKISLKEISKITGKSEERIKYITHHYGLPNKRWTDEEREFLLTNYQRYTCRELSRLLKRSIDSIRCQKYQNKGVESRE